MSTSLPTLLAREWRRLVFRWRRAQLDRELAEEIESHRLLKQGENARAGLTPQAARELSNRQMGNIMLAQEECRDVRSFVKLEMLMQDLRYAARMFARIPGFTAIAALSLAIGIGGNAAMFSLVDKLLVRPLPYFQPDRLVRVSGIYPRAAVPAFQQQSRTMDVAAASVGSDYNLTGQGEAIRIYGLVSYWVTQRTFEIGVRVAIGASRRRIVSMVLLQGLRVTLYGMGAGILAALAVTRFLASLLYGVGATDPLTFAAVIALIFGVAIMATALPAWRAARIDPVKSLRVD
jgi:hypothetical protein